MIKIGHLLESNQLNYLTRVICQQPDVIPTTFQCKHLFQLFAIMIHSRDLNVRVLG